MLDWTPDLLKKHLDEGQNVFLKLWKPGCGACKLSEPAVKRMEAEYSKDFLFAGINAAEYPEILEIAETDVLPVFFVFKDKKLAGKHIGFKGQAKLKDFINSSGG